MKLRLFHRRHQWQKMSNAVPILHSFASWAVARYETCSVCNEKQKASIQYLHRTPQVDRSDPKLRALLQWAEDHVI